MCSGSQEGAIKVWKLSTGFFLAFIFEFFRRKKIIGLFIFRTNAYNDSNTAPTQPVTALCFSEELSYSDIFLSSFELWSVNAYKE
jgi:hypothetical protein